MPRGAKSKLQASAKRRQARAKIQTLKSDQVIPTAGKEATPTSSPSREDVSQSGSAAGSKSPSRGRQRKPTTSTNSQGRQALGPGGISRGQQRTPSPTSSSASTSPERANESTNTRYQNMRYYYYNMPGPEVIMRKACLLEQFMLYKYKMKQTIKKEDMLKVINPVLQDHFAEILKKAAERIEMVFAMEVREVFSENHAYELVSKLKLPNNGRVRAGRGLPKTGLLMNILGMIFMKGNCAKEEDIWKFLAMMHVYAGRKHFMYGEPRKLITKDLVRLKYLEYRQVANSDPPRFEFLWGPKAHAETSKMQVLKFLSKVNDTTPDTFRALYEEALRDEKEKK
ncbi:PREDICTED: melanoma-associated antigen B5-like [Condylura cristata]|uniref:melanoma-associated antigen B5-like n=1 Tax=Condylura cristata TaxID=143302 RepID=UPI0003347B85|nr:PREDICTED: melanoma-associated antigen B5-like [Condylura cristata]